MNYISDIDYKVKKSAIHGIDPSTTLYNAVIEISNGDNVKYEVHPSGKYLTAVRTLNPIFRYPFSYGFIPQTLEEDGDGLDVIVITPEPLAHLSVIEIRVLGYVDTVDEGKADRKIIAVPAYSSLRKVSMDKVMAFLKNYKYPDTTGLVGEFTPHIAQADDIIERAHQAYVAIHAHKEDAQEKVSPIPVKEPVEAEEVRTKHFTKIVPAFNKEAKNEPIVSPTTNEAEVSSTCQPEQKTPLTDVDTPVKQEEKPVEKEVVKENTIAEPQEEKAESSAPFLQKTVEQVKEQPKQEIKKDTGWLS